MVKATAQPYKHYMYNSDTTHIPSRRTAATIRFSTKGVYISCQKQTAPSFANNPIRPGLYLASIHQMAPPRRGSTHLTIALLLIYRPRKHERLSSPSWLTCSGRFADISGHPLAAGQAQGRESSEFAGEIPTFYHCATQITDFSLCL